jgi:hypothetical protein
MLRRSDTAVGIATMWGMGVSQGRRREGEADY